MLQGGVTPLILTYNEEANIGRVLERLTWAPRIVVVDSFSTDATLDIVRRYPQADVVQRRFDSFANQCNFGLEHVETEWVLSMDADYVCTPELVREIEGLPPEPGVNGYAVSFRYCIFGRPLRGTLYPARIALYRRASATYHQDGHAHRVHVDGPIGELAAPILHDDRKPLDAWLAAQQKYAAQEADKLLATAPDQLGLADRLRRHMVLAPVLTPLYCLFVKGGLLDGRAGWAYTLQRTYAEVLLALRLLDRRLRREAPPEPDAATPPESRLVTPD